jgi:hypothetical protein
MFSRRSVLAAAALLPLIAQEAFAVDIKDPENTLIMQLKDGEVVIELLPEWRPSMSTASRRWRARASMTASPSIA